MIIDFDSGRLIEGSYDFSFQTKSGYKSSMLHFSLEEGKPAYQGNDKDVCILNAIRLYYQSKLMNGLPVFSKWELHYDAFPGLYTYDFYDKLATWSLTTLPSVAASIPIGIKIAALTSAKVAIPIAIGVGVLIGVGCLLYDLFSKGKLSYTFYRASLPMWGLTIGDSPASAVAFVLSHGGNVRTVGNDSVIELPKSLKDWERKACIGLLRSGGAYIVDEPLCEYNLGVGKTISVTSLIRNEQMPQLNNPELALTLRKTDLSILHCDDWMCKKLNDNIVLGG